MGLCTAWLWTGLHILLHPMTAKVLLPSCWDKQVVNNRIKNNSLRNWVYVFQNHLSFSGYSVSHKVTVVTHTSHVVYMVNFPPFRKKLFLCLLHSMDEALLALLLTSDSEINLTKVFYMAPGSSCTKIIESSCIK